LLACVLIGAGDRKLAGHEPQCDGVSGGLGRARRLVYPNDVIVCGAAIHWRRQGRRIPGGQPFSLKSDLADIFQNLFQALSRDVLHRVIADAVVLAIVEDADDVGVVQPGRRAGLRVETAEVVRAVAILRVHHFQRHVAAEGLANRFVNHAHTPFAQVAEDPVVAQLWGNVGAICRQRRGQRPIALLPRRLELFHQCERGKKFADVVGVFGVPPDVRGERRMLAMANPRGELISQPLEWIAVGGRFAHCSSLAPFGITQTVGRLSGRR
jgi:hypothetical protein